MVFNEEFDATPWFEKASAQEIIELVDEDWGPGEYSDRIALFCEQLNDNLETLFKYLILKNSGVGDAVGFSCTVDPDAAEAWLRRNRLDIYEQL